MTPFSCHVRTVGDTAVVTVVGEVDLSTHDRLVEAGLAPMAAGARVVLDCAGIGFLDSRGLTALLELRRHAEESGAGFALAAVPPSVARVLELSGTTAMFPVVELPVERPVERPSAPAEPPSGRVPRVPCRQAQPAGCR